MRVIDLSHPITADMPMLDGAEQPLIEPVTAITQHGYSEQRLAFWSHTGTHVESAAHVLPGGATLDALPASCFFGSGLLLDVRRFADGEIPLCAVQPLEKELQECEFLLLHTGFAAKWGSPAYFSGYPCLSVQAAAYLAALPQLKGLAADCASFDAAESTALPIHHLLLSAGKLLAENLRGLEQLPQQGFLLSLLPLNIKGGEACPTRAVALVV